ncbi:hypothetical protein Q5P01_018994 [Channa striata]|uniref:G-protein coupled receptors family 1 profile domain-containing protein n=1 Tax=Channa striata TaxID=64152 RepID=A0AA88M0P0_CHASR|nr:hypothetical protein Q5P01_018994 [Channa striata]
MSVLQPEVNITAGLQYQGSQEKALVGVLCTGTSCSFLYINSVLLFTLRSKPVFCETSRYILLYNLLFADTAHMVTNVLLFLLAALKIIIAYIPCCVLVLLSGFTDIISPLTLAVMSVERYVAVCHPLRHSAIFTTRSTGTAIALVWAYNFIYILVQVFMLLYVLTKIYIDLHLYDFCSKEAIFSAPIFTKFQQTYHVTVFFAASVTIMVSYIGVAIVAKSASTDRASARKALQTLLLHLIQLSLILTSTFFTTIIAAYATVGRLTLIRVYNVCFVCLNILPRCLSALIYGIKDQNIRPVFMKYLFCQGRSSVILNKK